MTVDVIFACGGTGGHIYPAIAVAQALIKEEKTSLFLISKHRQDAQIIPKYDFLSEEIPSAKRNPLIIIWAIIKTLQLLRQYQPKVFVGTGGYLTFPAIIAARIFGIPIILMEQNVYPGKVTRLLSQYADLICTSFPASKQYIKKGNIFLTGNPIRKVYLEDALYSSLQNKLPKGGKKLLVFGGSQGANSINRHIEASYEKALNTHDISMVHIVGKSAFSQRYGEMPYNIIPSKFGRNCIVVLPYFEHMKYVYDWADVVISRAGATTIAELLQYKKPAVLVPYPYAADNHQELNAQAFVETKAGKIVLQSDLEKCSLIDEAIRLIDSTGHRFPTVDTTQNVVEKILPFLGK